MGPGMHPRAVHPMGPGMHPRAVHPMGPGMHPRAVHPMARIPPGPGRSRPSGGARAQPTQRPAIRRRACVHSSVAAALAKPECESVSAAAESVSAAVAARAPGASRSQRAEHAPVPLVRRDRRRRHGRRRRCAARPPAWQTEILYGPEGGRPVGRIAPVPPRHPASHPVQAGPRTSREDPPFKFEALVEFDDGVGHVRGACVTAIRASQESRAVLRATPSHAGGPHLRGPRGPRLRVLPLRGPGGPSAARGGRDELPACVTQG
jgi:hypothetical protein